MRFPDISPLPVANVGVQSQPVDVLLYKVRRCLRKTKNLSTFIPYCANLLNNQARLWNELAQVRLPMFTYWKASVNRWCWCLSYDGWFLFRLEQLQWRKILFLNFFRPFEFELLIQTHLLSLTLPLSFFHLVLYLSRPLVSGAGTC